MADGSAMAAAEIAEENATPLSERPSGTRKFKVDFWATDFNTAEIGILKRTQNEAASDQFTKDMEIFGQTVIDGKQEALIAYRKELWNDETDMQRRLIIKVFSETLSWRGTAEMMIGRSMQLSLGSGVPVTVFSLNIARQKQVISLERCARKWPLLPERFTFFIETSNGPRFYTLRENFLSIGADYSLFDQQGRKIGHLHQRIVNLGGAWKVTLDKRYANKRLETVVELFCATLKFNRASRKHIRRTMSRVRSGKITPKLSHREVDLYYNPRRRR